ncbi:MAG: GerMN domain-containing protein [Clostridia bacterium]|nr:GerMN domain-containing protein [Clostridia bacterium]
MHNNKKIMILILLLVAVGIVIFNIAGNEDSENIKEVSLYFFNREGTAIVPVESEFSAENTEELYGKVAEALIKGPSGKQYMPIMDKNVKVNGIYNDSGNLTVDFSEDYRGSELMTTYAVVKTFSRLPDVKQVRVTVNDKNIIANGEELGFISGDEINTESDDDSATGIRLYFANSEKDALVMEYRKINITDTQPVEQYIVTELIKGPKNKNNTKLLASDTGVVSVETTDGTCYVNFKQDFIDKNAASEDTVRLVVYSVVNSLTERDNIKNVQLLIDGKKTEKFGSLDISGLLERNEALIEN